MKRFSDKAFLNEVTSVAKEGAFAYEYCDENKEHDPGLNITLGGSLDILHPVMGTCSNPECRRKEALNIARTAGLFANKIYIADHLSAYLAGDSDGEFYGDIRNIKLMVEVVKTFAPLINENIIELRTPFVKYCKDCIGNIKTEINIFLDSIIDADANINITCIDKYRDVNLVLVNNNDLNRLCGIASFTVEIPNYEKSFLKKLALHDVLTIRCRDNQYIFGAMQELLEDILMNVTSSIDSANKTSSLFLSKSELDTLFLASVDRNTPPQRDIDTWEAMRSINLPWVGELDIPQILMLRHQASASLESLREKLSLEFMQGGEKKATEVVLELTLKIAELKQEIMANDIVKKSSKRYSAGFGSLAITLVMYGLASNVPAAAVGSVAALLAALAHMRTSEKEQEDKNAKILTSPAYALLKAKDLLSCRE